MLTRLKTLFRRVDFFLRDRPFPNPEDGLITHSIDELFEEKHDPWYTTAYWYARRWTSNIYGAPRSTYYALKYAYQRLTRGWDDRAVWSIDWWLDDKMPAMLRKLKEDKHGIPMDMFDGLPTENDDGYTHSDETFAIAEERWNAILDKMIAAFEASRRMQNMTYEEELGEYPLYRPAGVERETWKNVQHDRYLASEVLRERDAVIFKEGMALFAEHYSSLWD